MRGHQRIRSGFWLVFWREFDWLRRRPLLLFTTTIGPLALMALLTAVFSAGLATRLPIGVVDLDESELSHAIIRMVDASPDVAVASQVAELSEGRHLILTGDIHGLLLLPDHLERDVLAGRRPEVTFFYNAQTMTAGNLVLRGVSAALPASAAGIRMALRSGQGEPLEAALSPVRVQTHALFNPALDYSHFLLAALLPAVLQVVIVTTMAYSIGADFQTRHRLRTLRRLGNGLLPAMAGKILPYTIVFLTVLSLSNIVLLEYFGLPLRGSRTLLTTAAILFILSSQLIGALLALFMPMSAVGIGTLLTAPAFGFMGVGFPRHGMNVFAYHFGELLPGTWYLMVRIDQTIRGTPFDLSIRPILVLLLFVLVLGVLTAVRLQAIGARTDADNRERQLKAASA